MKKIAILDDYQNVALKLADWSLVTDRAEVTVFDDHVASPEAVIERLLPFDAICVTAAAPPDALPPLEAQLAVGGRLVAPVVGAGDERLVRSRSESSGVVREELEPVRFVPLVRPS